MMAVAISFCSLLISFLSFVFSVSHLRRSFRPIVSAMVKTHEAGNELIAYDLVMAQNAASASVSVIKVITALIHPKQRGRNGGIANQSREISPAAAPAPRPRAGAPNPRPAPGGPARRPARPMPASALRRWLAPPPRASLRSTRAAPDRAPGPEYWSGGGTHVIGRDRAAVTPRKRFCLTKSRIALKEKSAGFCCGKKLICCANCCP